MMHKAALWTACALVGACTFPEVALVDASYSDASAADAAADAAPDAAGDGGSEPTPIRIGWQEDQDITPTSLFSNYIWGFPIFIESEVSLVSLHAQFQDGAAGRKVKMGLYANVNEGDATTPGEPGAKIVTTSAGLSESPGVVSFPVAEQSLPAGIYWLMAVVNSDSQIAQDESAPTPSCYAQASSFELAMSSQYLTIDSCFESYLVSFYVLVHE